MRRIPYKSILDTTEKLCREAAFRLPSDVYEGLRASVSLEDSPTASSILNDCISNADIACEKGIPICQDTGIACFFIELGEKVFVEGGALTEAVSEGMKVGYQRNYLRKSMVSDPVFDRNNTGDNTPPVIHIEIIPESESIRIIHLPKGGGAENMSRLAMLKPCEGEKGVEDFVVKSVEEAGGNPCPPVVVGVGIGGSFEKCALLAKKVLLRDIGSISEDPSYAALEQRILERINSTGIGAQGLGGRVTALQVSIDHAPCHIASMPVAVNINCHAARKSEAVI